MCLLTMIPAGIVVTDDIERMLRCGCRRNEDGFGWAIVIPGEEARIQVRHFMDADKALASFREARDRAPEGPALFHSRLATAGAQDLRGCHPFRVDEDPRTVVAHNGVLPAWAQPEVRDWRSDTRILADEFIALEALGSRRYRDAIGKQIRGDKLVFLTVDPRFERNVYIVNADHGEWAEGCWWSNDGYKPFRHYETAWAGWNFGEEPKAITAGWPKSSSATSSQLIRSEINERLWYNQFYCSACRGTKGAKDPIIDRMTETCQLCRSCALCLKFASQCSCWEDGKAERLSAGVNPLDAVPGPKALAAKDFWAGWSDDEIDEMVGIVATASTADMSDDEVNALTDAQWHEVMVAWIQAHPELMPEWYWTALPDGSYRYERV